MGGGGEDRSGGTTCRIGGVGRVADGGAARADSEPRIVVVGGRERGGEGGVGGGVRGEEWCWVCDGSGSRGKLAKERVESISEARVGRDEGGEDSGVESAVGRGERRWGKGHD